MDSETETPCATPTKEVQHQALTQLQPESPNERLAEVQSDLYSEIELVPITGSISLNILIWTDFFKPNSEFLCVISK